MFLWYYWGDSSLTSEKYTWHGDPCISELYNSNNKDLP